VVSKLGGLNIKEYLQPRKPFRAEVAIARFMWLADLFQLAGKAEVLWEETSTCTIGATGGMGSGIQGKIRGDNVGKNHLAAGTGNNLQRLDI